MHFWVNFAFVSLGVINKFCYEIDLDSTSFLQNAGFWDKCQNKSDNINVFAPGMLDLPLPFSYRVFAAVINNLCFTRFPKENRDL